MMNNKNIKIFFFDNDSTLFDHELNRISPLTIEALEILKSKGYKLVMNTSRSYEEMYNVPRQVLDLMDCLILLGGAYIIKDGKVSVSYINQDRLNKAIAYLDDNDLTYRYCLDNGGGYLNKDDDYKELFNWLYGMYPPIKKYEGEKVVHLLFYATGKNKDDLFEILKEEENVNLGRANEISPKGCNKGSAMLKVAMEYGFKQEEICAFGDSGNDFDMIKNAGLGIAVGTHCKELLEVADYVTDSVNEEGVYKALKHFEYI